MHEGLVAIDPLQGRAQIVGAGAFEAHIAGAELAPRHRDQMRGEIRRDGHTCGDADFLVDLRGMTVHGDGIGRQPLACFGEQRVLFQSAPGARDAGFGVDDEIMRVDEAAFTSGTSASNTAVG